ncbi:hypothetical protein AcV5_000765 [Taiwanofungus camphoratus]|nr:hypothetical protein AcW2_006604 [Antrodia cinnamomea]KAI0921726.1 hypothetical protein AcW2_006614 [Antrodia cinnamomea]KAI0939307.1 hypothetical protein AcV5_000765 [Antrodia cinnamomea]KAI0952220.1 hypothetical protein AcV7_008095 [Antrodia cinnamomea]KAI0952229.1 hypothetical protein AcV7_008104 [Antrodia cinnamomea]
MYGHIIDIECAVQLALIHNPDLRERAVVDALSSGPPPSSMMSSNSPASAPPLACGMTSSFTAATSSGLSRPARSTHPHRLARATVLSTIAAAPRHSPARPYSSPFHSVPPLYV